MAPTVQENYALLLSRAEVPSITPEISDFLDRICRIFENASFYELIELSHEDPEWIDKQKYYGKAEQRMNSLSHVTEYQEQYRDILNGIVG